MFTYRNAFALVTGASMGLGEAFAEALAARGANLVLVARSLDALNALAKRLTEQYGVQAIVLAVDLAERDAAMRISEELERQRIAVDLLVNNAGFGLTGEFLSNPLAREEDLVQVNIQALVGLSHRLGSAMAARNKGGIINVASNASFQPIPYMATYAASKAFVLHFSEALGHELAPRNVQVMATCPGPTSTRFFAATSADQPTIKMDAAEVVVRRTLEAFDRQEKVVYPGRSSVRITSWLPRFIPRALAVRAAAAASRGMGLH
ncbi:SDR family NAD(P)-dependent oxidoreductase [Pseudomonas batumici]|nr:SDR family oxidoreductase [Pseudomonas batumici]